MLRVASSVVVFTLASAGSQTLAAHASQSTGTQVAEALHGALVDTAEAYALRGVSAAVIMPGRDMWTGVYGLSHHGEPLAPDMLIPVASLTKTVTGALVLQLADEGLIDLDAPISTWFAPIENVPGEATVRQLLNHRSGIMNYGANPRFGPAYAEDTSKIWSPTEITGFIRPPRDSVDTRTTYSNSNMLLLGMIADSVTGSSLGAEFRRRFWDPLNLADVYLWSDEEPRGHPAGVWVGQAADQLVNADFLDIPIGRNFGWGAFGLVATPAAMAVWGDALLGGRFLSDSILVEMLTAVEPPPGRSVAIGTGVGLGVRRYDVAGYQVWGHSGVINVATSLVIRDQNTGVTVVTAVNQSPRTQRNSHFRVAAGLLAVANEAAGVADRPTD